MALQLTILSLSVLMVCLTAPANGTPTARQSTLPYSKREQDCLTCYSDMAMTACFSLLAICQESDRNEISPADLETATAWDYSILDDAKFKDTVYCTGVHERFIAESRVCRVDLGSPFDISAEGLGVLLEKEVADDGFNVVGASVTYMSGATMRISVPHGNSTAVAPSAMSGTLSGVPAFRSILEWMSSRPNLNPYAAQVTVHDPRPGHTRQSTLRGGLKRVYGRKDWSNVFSGEGTVRQVDRKKYLVTATFQGKYVTENRSK